MLTIHVPYKYTNEENGNIRLEAVVFDDVCKKERKIWYEVKPEYGEFLCTETADAFVLTALPFAVFSGQDICVKGNMSSELLYNTVHTHIPFFAEFLQKKPITITAESAETVPFSPTAVATGVSLGVDSLSTIYQHIDPDCQPEYRLTHLCLFNSCQFGFGEQEALDVTFAEACERSEAFAKELGLGFVAVNSNMVSYMYDYRDMWTSWLFHYFTLSCVMAMQKLFAKYLLSSSFNSKHVNIDYDDLSHTEAVFVPLIGNRNTTTILSDTFADRTEKTKRVVANPLSARYLDVCWSAFWKNSPQEEKGYSAEYEDNRKHRNCGWCDKCMRTLFTIELFGHLDEYREMFDMEQYEKHKNEFIRKIVLNTEHDIFYDEIYQLMLEKEYKVPSLPL